MDETNSVSKGVFVFKNGPVRAKGRQKPQPCSSFLDRGITRQLWFRSYKKQWELVERMILKQHASSYGQILGDLLTFIQKCHEPFVYEGVLPTAALLTGINQIDHLSRFGKLADSIRNNTTSIAVLLHSRDASSLKHAIEAIVENMLQDESKDCTEDNVIRKNQLNLDVLRAWYMERHKKLKRKPNLIVILPDFELFNPTVLQDLILVLDSYAKWLPFVLIFGVATAVTTIHNVLPYYVTSKISINIFQSEPSLTNLNNIFDEALFSPHCPLHLSGKVFELLVNIFLFYDFSINGFIQGIKYAFLEHYCRKSINGLCAFVNDKNDIIAMVKELSSSELEQIRQLPSFRSYVESLQHPQDVIDILTCDDYMKQTLPKMLIKVHNFWFTFHCALVILQSLVGDLPKSPLGKQLRELYSVCISSDVTKLPEFRDCIQLISYLSKEDMLQKIKDVLEKVLMFVDRNDQLSIDGCIVYELTPLEEMAKDLNMLADELSTASYEQIINPVQQDKQDLFSPNMGRQELRQKLLTAAKQVKNETGVTKAIGRITDYFVKHVFQRYLRPANKNCVALIELFLYDDSASIRRHIIGVPRAAVHTALNNPQYYTQCECCILDESCSIVPKMPDLSIAYKLHRECGRMINLFDWLQAFRTVIDDVRIDGEELQVDPKIQARFTRAVAELQFLGFIKMSKTKTDHVTRLTW
ncbi:origin recognition complex subunit 3 [Anopheles nili]|uniref:origin recognition complex subunit 3 n=1 Tax=Anopheles nili TaxID=185578 RepID=UPI00237A6D12|nr:origin recognition complex subunit 3 [Anopheles nili]